jgi:hypothetical protein
VRDQYGRIAEGEEIEVCMGNGGMSWISVHPYGWETESRPWKEGDRLRIWKYAQEVQLGPQVVIVLDGKGRKWAMRVDQTREVTPIQKLAELT